MQYVQRLLPAFGAALLAACSGAPNLSPGAPVVSNASRAASSDGRTASLGVPPVVLRAGHTAPAVVTPAGAALAAGDDARVRGRLYVSSPAYAGTVYIYPEAGKNPPFVGVFTNVFDPMGSAVDARGNVYATAFLSNSVSVFHPKAISPFRVLQDSSNPIGVAVDGAGTVYVSNIFNNEIAVFAPGSNAETGQLTNSKLVSPFYVAVDAKGDVYADGVNCQEIPGQPPCGGSTVIGYYPAGSTTFHELKLPIGFPGGLKLDTHGNLFVVDQLPKGGTSSAVEVFAPGKTKPSAVFPVGPPNSDVLDVALSADETRFFTADYSANTSEEYAYPSGTLVRSITVNQGSQGVSTGPPAIP